MPWDTPHFGWVSSTLNAVKACTQQVLGVLNTLMPGILPMYKQSETPCFMLKQAHDIIISTVPSTHLCFIPRNVNRS